MESELQDLEQWLKLGLVPKKDTEKHKEEIRQMKSKVEEEKERLQFLKESGEQEEYITPKRTPKASYAEGQNLPDIDVSDESEGLTDVGGLDLETEQLDLDTSVEEPADTYDETSNVEEEEEDPFSDSSRWKRGIADPEADDW